MHYLLIRIIAYVRNQVEPEGWSYKLQSQPIYGGAPELNRSSKTQTSNGNMHNLSTPQLNIFSSVLNFVTVNG